MGDNGNTTSNNTSTKLMNGHADVYSYQYLMESSCEKCDFCDKVSKNRYSSFIHNARHIIIPLLKQSVYQCLNCLHHFKSEAELNLHIINKHDITRSPHVLVEHTPLNNITVYEIPDSDYDSDHTLDVLRKKQDSIISDHMHYTKKPTLSSNKICENDISTVESSYNRTEIHNGIENGDSGMENDNSKVGYCGGIKDRLVFEEDISETERILIDFTKDCKVNLELFEAPWCEAKFDVYAAKTVHYDNLITPGMYKCRKCFKRFPNRHDTIIHETSHLALTVCRIQICNICNVHINGGPAALERHCARHHAPKIYKCYKCGMAYDDFAKHSKFYCPVLSIDHKLDYQEVTKVLNLCDMCFSFCKNSHSKTYVAVGCLSKLGKRFTCHRCGALFFELKLVERRVRRQPKKEKECKKRRMHSNEDRLKNIQHRLKQLKF